MSVKLDKEFISPVNMDEINKEILARAQSTEWSYGGRDSGFDRTPTSDTWKSATLSNQHKNDYYDDFFNTTNYNTAPRSHKSRPATEKIVHFEKTSRVLSEDELRSLGLDPSLFDSNLQLNEHEEEQLGGDRKKTVVFESVDEIPDEESRQEFYPYRDAHQGKPLPGDNEYGTWGSRFDDKERQWKLSNGQWVRVAKPKPLPPKPKQDPPRPKLASPSPSPSPSPPPGTNLVPYWDADVEVEPPLVDVDMDLEPTPVAPLRRIRPLTDDSSWIKPDDDQDASRSPSPELFVARTLPPAPLLDSPIDLGLDLGPPRARKPRALPVEPDVDLDALRDKYRPKTPKHQDDTKPASPPQKKSPPIVTAPIRLPTPPPQEIKLEPAKPIYVEMKRPLKKPEEDEEKRMEDPNLMWMRMGPAQYGPPFGTLGKRQGREEEWIGPPCELCHKQIEERRCMLAENRKFHCWHFSCCFCLKVLKPADFLIAEADNKPYCLNCHKREFPEISLAHLKLDADAA